MERNVKLLIAYDGANFHGWQTQPNLRTVQAELENVLRHVLRHPLCVHGASRTDAGVHARGQVAHVLTSSPVPVDRFKLAIGHHLPPDIALLHAAEVPRGFHASRSALGKLYRYRIFNAQHRPVSQQRDHHTWHVWFNLDLERLRAGAVHLVGTHDFAAFASASSNPRPSTVRTINRIDIRRQHEEILIDIEGDGFLYNQVRNIVGTLFEVGRGHWDPSRVAAILASRSRRNAAFTAPPQGLTLQWVRYPPLRDLAHLPFTNTPLRASTE